VVSPLAIVSVPVALPLSDPPQAASVMAAKTCAMITEVLVLVKLIPNCPDLMD